MADQCKFCPRTKAGSFLCEGTDCLAARADHYKAAFVESQGELEETRAELESLRAFTASEIRKLPPEFVKDKAGRVTECWSWVYNSNGPSPDEL